MSKIEFEYRTTYKQVPAGFPEKNSLPEGQHYWDLSPVKPKGEGWQLVSAVMHGVSTMLFVWERERMAYDNHPISRDRDPHQEQASVKPIVTTKRLRSFIPPERIQTVDEVDLVDEDRIPDHVTHHNAQYPSSGRQ